MKGNVIAKAYCREGNQMFIAAVAATYANKTNRNFLGLLKNVDGWTHDENMYSTIFKNIKFYDINEIDLSGFQINKFNEPFCDGYYPNFISDNVCFNGFFQDASLIDINIANKLFTPSEELLNDIYTFYGDLSDYVCIHLRRGDYLGCSDIFYTYTKEDLLNIINKYFYKEKIFFVSDDIKWCKDNFIGDRYKFADINYFYKPYIDLYLPGRCKANIISNSTFCWWAAYLNNKSEKVICHWPWFVNPNYSKCEYLLPKNWIKEY